MSYLTFNMRRPEGGLYCYKIEIEDDQHIELVDGSMVKAKSVELGDNINGLVVGAIYTTFESGWERENVLKQERDQYRMKTIALFAMLVVTLLWSMIR